MSNDSTVWNISPDNSTGSPLDPAAPLEGSSLVLLLLLGGTLVSLTSLLLVCCHRRHGYRCTRTDDQKTNTTYTEECPTHEITIRVEEAACQSPSSSPDLQTERFLSASSTGRRVSFNEAALFDTSRKEQEKGRRYTLTEGDFHHLKNARLINLHLPPPSLPLPPPTLHILTIHECDSPENSISMTTRPASKSALSIFQPESCLLPQTRLGGSPRSPLPGDSLTSQGARNLREGPPCLTPPGPHSKEPSTSSIEVGGASRNGSPGGRGGVCEDGSSGGLGPGGLGPGGQGPVQQFFSRLRRHTSLDGASPYFRIRRWKLEHSQRASSLDTRGSPKRRQFQRQRAASESLDQEDQEGHHIDLIQYIARTQDPPLCPGCSPHLLHPPSTPPPSLGRLEVEVVVEPSRSREGPAVIGMTPDPKDEAVSLGCHQESSPPDAPDLQAEYRDIWTLRASLEEIVSDPSNDKDSDSMSSLGGRRELPNYSSQDLGEEGEETQESVDSDLGTRKLLQMDSGYTSMEAPLRAAEELRIFPGGTERTALERRRHFTSAGRAGTVGESAESSLFQEEEEEEGLAEASGGITMDTGVGPLCWSPYGQMFPSREPLLAPPTALHHRDYSIDEKTDALFHEFLRHDPQFDQQESPLRRHRSRLHLRKQWQHRKQYSDPGVRLHSSFDRHRTPLRRGDSVNYPLESSYPRTLPCIISTPDEEGGSEGGTSEGATSRPKTPKEAGAGEGGLEEDIGRGDSPSRELEVWRSMSTPPDVQPTTPPSEKAPPSEQTPPSEQAPPSEQTPPSEQAPPSEQTPPSEQAPQGRGPQTVLTSLSDKLVLRLEEHLYSDLQRVRGTAEDVSITVAHTSPDHSPV